jgi:hypothetical protein
MTKPAIPAVTFFCTCGASFHELGTLKAHQVYARHTPTSSYEPPRVYAEAVEALVPVRSGSTGVSAPTTPSTAATSSRTSVRPQR